VAVQGRFEEHDFAAILHALTRLPATGLLLAERGGVEKRLSFWHGQIVTARSTDPADRVGDFLRSSASISSAELSRAHDAGDTTLIARMRTLGILDRARARTLAFQHATEVVLGLFAWTEGSFVFESGAASTVPGGSVALPELVFRGVERLTDRSRLQRMLGGSSAEYRFLGATPHEVNALALEPREWGLLNLLSEPIGLASLCRESSLDAHRVEQLLVALRTLGLVERCGAGEPATQRLFADELSHSATRGGMRGDDLTRGDAWTALRDSASEGEPLHGSLTGLTLPDVLRGLYVAQASGVLSARSGSITNRLYLSAGMIVSASPTACEDRLGQTLVRLGSLATEDLASARSAAGAAPLARYLLAREMVTGEQLRRALSEQIRTTVRSMIEWTGGSYWFEEKTSGLAELPLPRISMADVIIEAVGSIDDVSPLRDFFRSLRGSLAPSEAPRLRYQDVRLEPAAAYLLSCLDGRTSVADAVAVSALDEETSWRLVFGFVASGLVAVGEASSGEPSASPPEVKPAFKVERLDLTSSEPAVSAPPPLELTPPTEDANHYEILGLEPGATLAEVEAAHRELARSYHPDRAQTPQQKAILEIVFARVNVARRVLTSSVERPAYDRLIAPTPAPDVAVVSPIGAAPATPAAPESDRSPEAVREELVSRLVQAGIEAERRCDYMQALRYLERASNLDPDHVECLVHLAQVLAVNPKWRRNAIEMFESVLEKAPSNVAARLGIGRLHLQSGRRDAASEQFRLVLENDPMNREAAQALSELRPRVGSALGNAVRGVFQRRKRPASVS